MRRDKFNFCPVCGKEGVTYDCPYEEYMIYATCKNWKCSGKKFSDSFHTDDEALKDWRRAAYPKVSHA